MLLELTVRGLGVIESTELVLGPGCSALTGETGAGKTLVVAALDLLLGGRGDRTLVRDGAGEARVEGRFLVASRHRAAAVLRDHELLEQPDEASSEVELVVTRVLGEDGRSRARVNGALATVGLLAELGDALVEIAGQREHARILAPSVQRDVLDAFAGADCVRLAEETAAAVRRASRAGRRAETLAAEAAGRERELDALRVEVAEIEAVEPRPGETEELRVQAARLEQAETISAGLFRILEALRGDGGVEELLAEAARESGFLAAADPALGPLGERLKAAAYEISDVALELAERRVVPDPEALAGARGRLAALARLQRRYGPEEDEILARLLRARSGIDSLSGAEGEAERAAKERDDALAAAEGLALALSDRRLAERSPLAARLEELLRQLALPDTRVEVTLVPQPLYEGGRESVEILVATNPGEEPRPLAKVASGGELARIALAVHLLSAAEGPETLVFDEVDAGVGGEAAQAVGLRLAQLAAARDAQVLVVTHLPQVAAFADAHLKVSKSSGGSRASASVARVEGEERVAELSRMLAGLPSSERARGHARELLDLAASAASG